MIEFYYHIFDCRCPPGYTGNALSSCQRGECLSNEECPDHRACINYQVNFKFY